MRLLQRERPDTAVGAVPCVSTPLRVYTYRLPRRYRGVEEADGLELASQSFHALKSFFATCTATRRPSEADYFFVPLNLIHFQFENEDPGDVLDDLKFLSDRRDHILVACGDFSQRSKRNHQGEAYLETYDWLDRFILLAHESTEDLIPGQDIGIIPWSTLSEQPAFNTNERPLLYSFLGQLRHVFLGPDHARTRLAEMERSLPDAFIGSSLEDPMREVLGRGYPAAKDEFELISRNSVFTLAPAGYGRWTYRFFQAIAWGSIPVLISDDYLKPFADSIPYERFSVTIAEKDLDDLDGILRGYSASEIEALQQNLREHQADFTKRSFLSLLTRRLIEMKPSR